MRYIALMVAAVLVACIFCRSQQPGQQQDLINATARMQFVAEAMERSADELERGEPVADVVREMRYHAHTIRMQVEEQP